MPHAGPFWHGDGLKIEQSINRVIYNIYNILCIYFICVLFLDRQSRFRFFLPYAHTPNIIINKNAHTAIIAARLACSPSRICGSSAPRSMQGTTIGIPTALTAPFSIVAPLQLSIRNGASNRHRNSFTNTAHSLADMLTRALSETPLHCKETCRGITTQYSSAVYACTIHIMGCGLLTKSDEELSYVMLSLSKVQSLFAKKTIPRIRWTYMHSKSACILFFICRPRSVFIDVCSKTPTIICKKHDAGK